MRPPRRHSLVRPKFPDSIFLREQFVRNYLRPYRQPGTRIWRNKPLLKSLSNSIKWLDQDLAIYTAQFVSTQVNLHVLQTMGMSDYQSLGI